MDVRTQIINNVLGALVGIENAILDRIENALHIQLKDYEIQERCTEIIPHDGTNLGMVRKFIATKRLEGKSEKTLEHIRG